MTPDLNAADLQSVIICQHHYSFQLFRTDHHVICVTMPRPGCMAAVS